MSFLKDFKDLKKDISTTINENENAEQFEAQEFSVNVDQAAAVQHSSSHSDREDSESGSEESSVIAKGTTIEGNLTSEGSIAVYGAVHGDIQCAKKLIVTGKVTGNLDAGEIFINKASIDGEVVSEGNLKIGNNSVVLGNVFGKTAVIAGAVKGEIDIHGPVIIDNTAVIKGNIKSASVQINNGAVIEGYCTQCYHDVDVNAIFDDTFPQLPKGDNPGAVNLQKSIDGAEAADTKETVAQEQDNTTEQNETKA
jgi:cytoskeletal protein CcmA (bactofilin family)